MDNELHWFYISPWPNTERKVKAHLEACGIQCILPVQRISYREAGVNYWYNTPTAHGVLFARSTMQELEKIRVAFWNRGLRFVFRYESKESESPITISDEVMDDVLFALSQPGTICINPHKFLPLALKSDYVEVIEGPLRGLRGYWMRPRKTYCVTIIVNDVFAVATRYLPPEMVRVLTEEERNA